MFVTIYSLATLPALPNLDIPNILVILDSLSGLPTHATPDKIAALATHSSLDTINTIISFTILATFPTVAKLIILATPPTQPILANLLILPINSCWCTLTIIVSYHMYTCYTPCTSLILIFLIFWLFLIVFLDFLHHATPDNIAVLATHSSLDTINTIISFTILAKSPTVANLITVATLTAQQILANLLIRSTNSSLYTIKIIVCHHI